MALVSNVLPRILSHFPRKGLQLAFAYGSGIYSQVGHTDKTKNMVDLIFSVDNAKEWHEQNLRINPSHYSCIRRLGASRIAALQQNYGARIYFNTLVPCEGRIIKYGVITSNDLVNDLLDWQTLYVSGRLHKPVHVIHGPTCDELTSALQTNLQSAVHTALLLMDDSFSERQFYHTIANISYAGDFRMKVGEDQLKVSNIVDANMEGFRALYGPLLEQEEHVHWNKESGTLDQAFSPTSQYHHLHLLPTALQDALVTHRNRLDGHFRDAEEVLRSFSQSWEVQEVIEDILRKIVQQSSLSQSLKGILTAGLAKSYRYSLAKLRKGLRSRKRDVTS